MVILADIQINDVLVLLDFLFQNLKQLILEIQLKMADKSFFPKSMSLLRVKFEELFFERSGILRLTSKLG